MGHIRLGTLPHSKKWKQVVALIAGDAPVEEIAGAAADAANGALRTATQDHVFAEAIWLMANLPLAARAPGFEDALRQLGVDLAAEPSLFALTSAVFETLDRRALATGGRTDLGEMAAQALVESLTTSIEPALPSLFAPTPGELRTALGRFSSGSQFAMLARQFFARLTQRTLDYYLSRELAKHVGPGRRFANDAERRAFDQSLATHCAESSRIVEAYSGGWYGKTVWRDGTLDRDAARKFAAYSLQKIRDELGRRREAA